MASQMSERKIKGLAAGGSMVNDKTVAALLCADSRIEVVGTAMDRCMSRNNILEVESDVMLLVTEMPKMGCITFLKT